MIALQSIHHVAIICSDYQASKRFYTEVLGLSVAAEHYRQDRQSWKLDLNLHNGYILELFSFPESPARLSHPEACGLRHLAFSIADLNSGVSQLGARGVTCEPIRVDPYTGKRFTFFLDPDGLPLELYEL
jgi:glyoxylase I family protein